MLGQFTIQVGKTIDEYCIRLGSVVSNKITTMVHTGQNDIEFSIMRISLFIAAYNIYKGNEAHPKILWGNFWFLYYQAWLWKFSQKWRESVTEVWLKRLHDKGELERLLSELVESV